MRKRNHSMKVRDPKRQEPGRLLQPLLHNSIGRIAGNIVVGSSIGCRPHIGHSCTLLPDQQLQLHRLLLEWLQASLDSTPSLLAKHEVREEEEEVLRAMEGWGVLQLTRGAMVVEEVVKLDIVADHSCNVAMSGVGTAVLGGVDSVDVGFHRDSSKVIGHGSSVRSFLDSFFWIGEYRGSYLRVFHHMNDVHTTPVGEVGVDSSTLRVRA